MGAATEGGYSDAEREDEYASHTDSSERACGSLTRRLFECAVSLNARAHGWFHPMRKAWPLGEQAIEGAMVMDQRRFELTVDQLFDRTGGQTSVDLGHHREVLVLRDPQ